MIKLVLAAVLLISAFCAPVPCNQFAASPTGNVTNCDIRRKDTNTIEWKVQINFNQNFNWKDRSWSNILDDITNPNIPEVPVQSSCTSNPGQYNIGQSLTIHCTQAFIAIPRNYVNIVSAFEETAKPLGFTIKIPLSFFPENLKQEWFVHRWILINWAV